MRNLVTQDLIVDGDKNQPLELRLRHKQTVERIAMQLRKLAGPLSMFDSDGQRLKPVLLKRPCGRSRKGQLA